MKLSTSLSIVFAGFLGAASAQANYQDCVNGCWACRGGSGYTKSMDDNYLDYCKNQYCNPEHGPIPSNIGCYTP
ncbi:hypothetical protein BU16DRAFT_556957 [Lophium mytilinum]|uniref:Uncharacterized protein n=1 Tax=Lophium mytilinum TaxID=390894 RepID=A0A6A6R7P8_9PEZI|nr:hypothetical protein BU16DRAFT_556957 [Lophium mytilinum]